MDWPVKFSFLKVVVDQSSNITFIILFDPFKVDLIALEFILSVLIYQSKETNKRKIGIGQPMFPNVRLF